MNRKLFSAEYFILLIFIFGWMLIWPFGEFPINDDFAYNSDVKRFIDTGIFSVHTWSAAIYITQLLYGVLFAKLFGFSFIVLRIAVSILSLLTIIFFYKRVKRISHSSVALLFSLVLLVNPMWMYYSVTFMTEIPFALLLFIATIFYIDYLESDNLSKLFCAVVVSILAVLLRQFAILLPLAFSFVYVIKVLRLRRPPLKSLLIIILPVLLTAIAMYIATSWLTESRQQIGEVTAKFDNIRNTFSKGIIYVVQRIFFCSYAYLIYAFMPLAPMVIVWVNKGFRFQKIMLLVLLLLSLMMTFAFQKSGFLFPFLDNTISVEGIGPILIDGRAFELKESYFWIILTFIFVFSLNYILFLVFRVVKFNRLHWIFRNYVILFLIIFVIAYLLATTIVFPFDRYIVPVIPTLLFLMLKLLESDQNKILQFTRVTYRVIAFCLFIFFLVTVFSLSDSFKVQRARWELANKLIDNKVSPSHIDGGFEFNGWFTYKTGSILTSETKNWWWVNDNKYLISFNNHKEGYKVIDQREVSRLIPIHKQKVFLLQRQ